MPDGSILINSFETSNYITKIASTGDLVYHKQYNTTDVYGQFSPFILGDDNFIYFTFHQYGAGNQPITIIKLDPETGEVQAVFNYSTILFGGNPGPHQFYITNYKNGKFQSIGRSSSPNFKTFAAYLLPEANRIENIVSFDTLNYAQINCFTSANNHIYYASSSSSLIGYSNDIFDKTFRINSIDPILSKGLDKEIELDIRQINPRRIRVIDNMLFVVGDCVRISDEKWSGFVLKLDLEGNILQEKYFLLYNDTHLTDISKIDDNLIILGYTSSFGKGKEQNNRFYLKTNEHLEY
jgi:hypothetical protein